MNGASWQAERALSYGNIRAFSKISFAAADRLEYENSHWLKGPKVPGNRSGFLTVPAKLKRTNRGHLKMRHLTALAAALGLVMAFSAPTLAATNHTAIEFAAAKKKVDCKDPKNADNKACKKAMKKTDLSVTFSAAKKKKVDCKDPKNADNKACKKK
jgi:hypothetical protein